MLVGDEIKPFSALAARAAAELSIGSNSIVIAGVLVYQARASRHDHGSTRRIQLSVAGIASALPSSYAPRRLDNG